MIGRHIQLAEIVYNALENGEEIIPSALIDKIKDEELQSYVHELVFDKYEISKNWDDIHPGDDAGINLQKIAKDTVIKFKVEKINYRIAANDREMEQSSIEEEIHRFIKIKKDLEDRIKVIKKELGGN